MAQLTVEHLYEVTPRVLSSLVGAPCHGRCVVAPELAAEVAGVDAVFLPRSGVVAVHPAIAERERAFCDEHYTSGRLAEEASERWEHKLVNGSIDARLHACAHSLGPADGRLALLEWASYVRYPHAAVISEGVAECVVEEVAEAYREETGLAAVDPRLLEAPPIRRRHAAQAQLVRDLCAEVARALGTTARNEIFALAADGAGQLAVWRLALRWSAAQLFGDVRVLAKPGAILDLRRSLERSLAGLRDDWLTVDGMHGRQDDELGAIWARTAVRDYAETVRRIHAGPDGLPDIAAFTAQLSAAAQAAQASMSESLDEVSLALEQLMALGGEEPPAEA